MLKRINDHNRDSLPVEDEAAIVIVDHDLLTYLELFNLLSREDKLATVTFMAKRLPLSQKAPPFRAGDE